MSKAPRSARASLALAPVAPQPAPLPVPYYSSYPAAIEPSRPKGPKVKPHTFKRGAVNAAIGAVSTASIRTAGNTYEHLTGKSPALVEAIAGLGGVLAFERQSIPGQIADKALTDAVTRVSDVGSKAILEMLFPKKDESEGIKTSMR